MLADESSSQSEQVKPINGTGLIPVHSIPDTWSRAGLKALCFAAVAIEPFFSWFLAGATRDAINQLIKDFITDAPSVGVLNGVETVSYIMAGFNLYCDYISVSPARDADELINGFAGDHPEVSRRKSIEKALTIGLLLASIVLSFPQGAAADNIPISQWIFKRFGETVGAYIFNYTALVSIGLLGTIYYTMFNYGRMKNHMEKFVDIAAHPLDFANHVFSSKFLGYVEVGMQALSNTLYRAVNFGFLVSDEIQHILRRNNKSPAAKTAIIATMIETGVLTLFTRTLSAHKHFLNPDFKYVENEVNALHGFRLGTISDVSLSALRGIGIGIFSYLMFDNFGVGFLAGYSLGFVSMCLSLVERYNVAKHEKALEQIGSRELERRKESAGGVRNEPASAFDRAAITYDAIGKSLRYPLKLSEMKSYISFAFVLFWFTLIANFIARCARLISFYGFSDQLSKTMGWGFSKEQNAALTGFAGGEVTKNDFANFRDSNDNTIRDYRVSYYLQHQRDVDSHNTGWVGAFTRVFRTVWNASPGSYSQAELNRALMSAQQDDEENQSLLRRPRPATPTRSIQGGDPNL